MNEESGNPPSNLNDQNRTQKEESGDQLDNSMNIESVEDHGDKLNAASSDQLGETNEEKASTHIYYFLLLAAFMDLVYIAILKRKKLSVLVLEGNWKMALVKEPIVSEDGKVRRVKLGYRTAEGTKQEVERAVQRLIPLVPSNHATVAGECSVLFNS